MSTKIKTNQLFSADTPRQLSYDRVREAVLEMIVKDKFQPGDRLPSERELSRRLGLNHLTVRKGLTTLVSEQIIDRRVGAGTFLRTVPDLRQFTLRNTPINDREGQATFSKVSSKNLIGILAFSNSDTFALELLGYLHKETEKRELDISIRMISGLDSKASQVVEEMARQGCSGVLLPWIPDEIILSNLAKLVQSSPIPVVLPRLYQGLEANCCEKPTLAGQADYLAIEMACRYFKLLNYSNIAFLGPGNRYSDSISRRVLSYTQFMNISRMDTHVGLVTCDSDDVDQLVGKWKTLAGDLAVVCYDDDHAFRLITSLHKHNLRIPEDVAVLGFNNISLGQSIDPPLSSIQFDYTYVAQGMLDHVQAMAKGESAQAEGGAREVLVIRESCGGRLRQGLNIDQVTSQAQAVWDERT